MDVLAANHSLPECLPKVERGNAWRNHTKNCCWRWWWSGVDVLFCDLAKHRPNALLLDLEISSMHQINAISRVPFYAWDIDRSQEPGEGNLRRLRFRAQVEAPRNMRDQYPDIGKQCCRYLKSKRCLKSGPDLHLSMYLHRFIPLVLL